MCHSCTSSTFACEKLEGNRGSEKGKEKGRDTKIEGDRKTEKEKKNRKE